MKMKMIFILVIAKFYCNFLKFPLKVFFDMAIVLFTCYLFILFLLEIVWQMCRYPEPYTVPLYKHMSI